MARLRLGADVAEISARVPQNAGELTDLGDGPCELVTGASTLDYLVAEVLWLDVPVEVLDPPELAERMREIGQRLLRASGKSR